MQEVTLAYYIYYGFSGDRQFHVATSVDMMGGIGWLDIFIKCSKNNESRYNIIVWSDTPKSRSVPTWWHV